MTSSGGRVRISRDKLVGVLVALACLAFSAIGLKVNDPPEFTYVDGVRGQAVSIEQADLIVGDVEVGTRLVNRGRVEAQTQGMFVVVRARLEVPGPAEGLAQQRSRDHPRPHLQPVVVQHTPRRSRLRPGGGARVRGGPHADRRSLARDLGRLDGARVLPTGARAFGITADNADQRRQAGGRELQPASSGATEALP